MRMIEGVHSTAVQYRCCESGGRLGLGWGLGPHQMNELTAAIANARTLLNTHSAEENASDGVGDGDSDE